MTAKIKNDIAALAKEHRWQELLRTLPVGEPMPLVLDSAQSLNNLRSVAARLNTMKLEEDKYRYSFSGLNYDTKTICVLASKRQEDA